MKKFIRLYFALLATVMTTIANGQIDLATRDSTRAKIGSLLTKVNDETGNPQASCLD